MSIDPIERIVFSEFYDLMGKPPTRKKLISRAERPRVILGGWVRVYAKRQIQNSR